MINLNTLATVQDAGLIALPLQLDEVARLISLKIGAGVLERAQDLVHRDTESLADSLYEDDRGAVVTVGTAGSQADHIMRKFNRVYQGDDYSYAFYREYGTINNDADLFMTDAAQETFDVVEIPVLESFTEVFP